MAFGVLADVATGAPLLLAELTLATAMRTAAMSALAARALARPGSRTMALIGNGAQAEFQALAFRDLVGIATLRLFDTDRARHRQAAAQPATARASTSWSCASAAEAVRGADIVTTVTADKSRATIVTPAMVEPGMHLNAVGGDCPGKTELHPRRAARRRRCSSSTSRRRASRATCSRCRPTSPSPSCGACSPGRRAGRSGADEVTVFDSVGFALEDYSTLRFLRDAALELGIGDSVQLVPQLRRSEGPIRHARCGARAERTAGRRSAPDRVERSRTMP